MTTAQLAGKSDYPLWERYLLIALGAPQNHAQLEALNLWAQKEGLPGDANNWLALTDPNDEFGQAAGDPRGAVADGVWNYDKNGNPLVVTFPTQAAGIAATVKFLNAGYTDIIDELRNPNATVESIGAVVASHSNAWGGDGNYIASGGNGTIYNDTGTGTQGPADVYKNGPTGKLSFKQCNPNDSLLGENGVKVLGFTVVPGIHLFNACQLKAVVSGLITGLGVAIMGLGVTLVVLNSNTVEGVVSDVRNTTKKAAKLFPGPEPASNRTARANLLKTQARTTASRTPTGIINVPTPQPKPQPRSSSVLGPNGKPLTVNP
jgi:hypothetical protein